MTKKNADVSLQGTGRAWPWDYPALPEKPRMAEKLTPSERERWRKALLDAYHLLPPDRAPLVRKETARMLDEALTDTVTDTGPDEELPQGGKSGPS